MYVCPAQTSVFNPRRDWGDYPISPLGVQAHRLHAEFEVSLSSERHTMSGGTLGSGTQGPGGEIGRAVRAAT